MMPTVFGCALVKSRVSLMRGRESRQTYITVNSWHKLVFRTQDVVGSKFSWEVTRSGCQWLHQFDSVTAWLRIVEDSKWVTWGIFDLCFRLCGYLRCLLMLLERTSGNELGAEQCIIAANFDVSPTTDQWTTNKCCSDVEFSVFSFMVLDFTILVGVCPPSGVHWGWVTWLYHIVWACWLETCKLLHMQQYTSWITERNMTGLCPQIVSCLTENGSRSHAVTMIPFHPHECEWDPDATQAWESTTYN